MNSMAQVMIGILWFVIAIVMTTILFMQGWFTIIGNLMVDTYAYFMYWIGLIILLLILVFIIPANLVIGGFQEREEP